MKILIVDDDPIAIQLLSNCLLESGFSDLTAATSAETAEHYIGDNTQNFDCFLLDISMPGKSGIELCADIRDVNRYQETPILMITRMKERRSIEAAFQNGATDYITKPFEYFEVAARIKIAQRLSMEGQAALDGHLEMPSGIKGHAGSHSNVLLQQVNNSIAHQSSRLQGKNLLPIYVFRNYLERITRSDNCCVDVIAIRIENIGKTYSLIKGDKFIEFLGVFVDAIRDFSAINKVFVTHIGDGTFLCAADSVGYGTPEVVEQGVMQCFSRRISGVALRHEPILDITVSEPLQLLTASKPNFNRLLKATKTRVNIRLSEKIEKISMAS
ncbi:response regulator [Roseibium sp.]|uniref:response regulator n=1 Tax=Roseibium sp. TaxID=1936156 RepID=UPI003A974624